MIDVFIVIILSILFVYGLKRIFFFKILKKISEEVFNGFQILFDKGRLMKRTQLKRTSYRVLGKSEKEEIQDMDSNKVC